MAKRSIRNWKGQRSCDCDLTFLMKDPTPHTFPFLRTNESLQAGHCSNLFEDRRKRTKRKARFEMDRVTLRLGRAQSTPCPNPARELSNPRTKAWQDASAAGCAHHGPTLWLGTASLLMRTGTTAGTPMMSGLSQWMSHKMHSKSGLHVAVTQEQ